MENDIHVYDRYEQTMEFVKEDRKLLSLEVNCAVTFPAWGTGLSEGCDQYIVSFMKQTTLKALHPDLPAVTSALRFYISTK